MRQLIYKNEKTRLYKNKKVQFPGRSIIWISRHIQYKECELRGIFVKVYQTKPIV